MGVRYSPAGFAAVIGRQRFRVAGIEHGDDAAARLERGPRVGQAARPSRGQQEPTGGLQLGAPMARRTKLYVNSATAGMPVLKKCRGGAILASWFQAWEPGVRSICRFSMNGSLRFATRSIRNNARRQARFQTGWHVSDPDPGAGHDPDPCRHDGLQGRRSLHRDGGHSPQCHVRGLLTTLHPRLACTLH